MRWKTLTWRAWRAISGIDWMPDEPVPMTPTTSPAKSTGSCGQVPVWKWRPLKSARPGMSGTRAAERQPVAITTKRAVAEAPSAVVRDQRFSAAS